MGGGGLTCRSEEEESSRNQPVESHVEPFRPRLYFKGENLKNYSKSLEYLFQVAWMESDVVRKQAPD